MYFAYGYPYTYSDLNLYLNKAITQNNNLSENIHVKRREICKTLANNSLECITITSTGSKNLGKKIGVVFLGR